MKEDEANPSVGGIDRPPRIVHPDGRFIISDSSVPRESEDE
jgi:hypothetical protein